MGAAARARTPVAFGALALLLLVVYALAFQGARGLWSPDEGRYVQVAVEMLEDGDFLHPRLHQEQPHYSKPPGTYWALAASLAAFGHEEWAARLPNALAFVLTVLLLVPLGRDLCPARPRLPALVYAAMLLPYIAENSITTDTLLTLCTTLYGAAFVRARASPGGARPRGVVLILWLGAALAFMVKGPPALLPLLGLFAFALGERRVRPLSHYVSAPALLLFVVVAFAWFAKVLLDDPGLAHYFLVNEVVNRVASADVRRNAQWYGAFAVYVPTLLLGTLPWSWPIWRRAFGALGAPRAALASLRAQPDTRLLLWWIGLPLAVFVLARSRLPFYLLPLFVPLALGCARALPARLPRWFAPGLALWLLALVAFRLGFAHWPSKEDDRVLAEGVRGLGVERIDELAFLDTVPRYGLGFYLGAEIERVSADYDPNARVPAQHLADELKESEGCRVLLVEAGNIPELRRELQRLDVEARELGKVGEFDAYAIPVQGCRLRGAAPG